MKAITAIALAAMFLIGCSDQKTEEPPPKQKKEENIMGDPLKPIKRNQNLGGL